MGKIKLTNPRKQTVVDFTSSDAREAVWASARQAVREEAPAVRARSLRAQSSKPHVSKPQGRRLLAFNLRFSAGQRPKD